METTLSAIAAIAATTIADRLHFYLSDGSDGCDHVETTLQRSHRSSNGKNSRMYWVLSTHAIGRKTPCQTWYNLRRKCRHMTATKYITSWRLTNREQSVCLFVEGAKTEKFKNKNPLSPYFSSVTK